MAKRDIVLRPRMLRPRVASYELVPAEMSIRIGLSSDERPVLAMSSATGDQIILPHKSALQQPIMT